MDEQVRRPKTTLRWLTIEGSVSAGASYPQIVSVVAPRERAVEPSLQGGQGLALVASEGAIVAGASKRVVAAEERVKGRRA